MNFYDNLTESGMFFFWIIIILVIILIIFSIILLNKNKKLKEIINKEDENDNVLPINNDFKEENINDTSFNLELKDDDADQQIIEIEKRIEPEIEIKEEIKKEEKPKVESSISGAYQRNVLREMSRRMPISPIHIEKHDIDDNTSIYTVSNKEEDYDLDDIYLREDSISPLEEMEDSYEVNDNMKYAGEIVSRMEEEIKPSNIELTDYEKKQEEEAIISYDELQKVKDKIYNITEDEETDEFIDELKNFRLDLR